MTGRGAWLHAYWKDFKRRFVNLLGYQFRKFSTGLALSVLQQKDFDEDPDSILRTELTAHLSDYDLKRLELYSNNLVDHHLITDLLPVVAHLYFAKRLANVQLSAAQSAILLGLGLQYKTVDDLVKELDLPASQLLALFNRALRKIVQHLNGVCEKAVEVEMGEERRVIMQPVSRTLQDDLDESAREVERDWRKRSKLVAQAEQATSLLSNAELQRYSIRGTETDWGEALQTSTGLGAGTISVKSGEKRKRAPVDATMQSRANDERRQKKKAMKGGKRGRNSL